ncbi:hypothetical protein DL766_004049 [Monosporascus sp. MC13-8B]|uniref:Peptidase A1 domain-containing protein n=1 Tax=Monosporascus cannonballus TaxID=155416 RepID=A0ABY0H046_9PEZI|nr:hypothetical protein DL762_007090 [Monosporascus cannonballus]RYO99140.1 hypothetical protein DL763_001741 [Monosporascus cannonballus]RYP32209.1 hypothetical protein DL766_004049 [Monosporascus sp. MC13-8B]
MACLVSIRGVAALWFAFFAVVSSVPILEEMDDGSLAIPVTHNMHRARSGPLEMYKTFRKYNIEIPDALQRIVNKQQQANKAAVDHDGSVPATSEDGDLLWSAPVGIGTPPQILNVDMDTGSTDTWLFSTDTAKEEVKGQSLYDPGKSSTSKLIPNCSWSILYGDFSSSSGICYKDTLTLGNIPIHDMTIESATTTSRMFTETETISGLVGLGWPYLAQTVPKQKTLIEFLPDVLKEPMFTVDLKHNATGSFNFGFINHSLYSPNTDIEYLDVDTSEGFWTVLHKGFTVGVESLKYEFSTPKEVIVDTGTTLLFIPDHAVDTYFEKVPGANYSYEEYGYLVPCDATPPDLTIELSDAAGNTLSSTIPGEYIVYAHISDEMCYAGVQSLGAFSPLEGILGDVFLKSSFSVFDIGKKRYGVAPKPVETSVKRDTVGDANPDDAVSEGKVKYL